MTDSETQRENQGGDFSDEPREEGAESSSQEPDEGTVTRGAPQIPTAEEHPELDDVQEEGVDANQIIKIGFVSLVIIAILIVLSLQMIDRQRTFTEKTYADRVRYPELEELQQQARQKLNGYEVVTSDSVYRIPIERAMDLVARERYGSQGASE